ncbi:MAG: leucine--tRNA ligase [Dehalococcoidales bacterium]|jgi:leucyl-tRNA synthetase|nr:leucine--tRNA ligase [Dehalococcoidales bacterium]MDP6576494.1 leucine--tRNA ligase [Dehalococcoidales bacterium]
MTVDYNPQAIEPKWQQKWADDQLYQVKDDDPRPKFYALTMFPYTSGDLHIGHWYAMAPADVHARFKRMQGYNVLHPMGFDAFGLPAENAAIKRSIHPFIWTMQNVDNMRRQLRSIGAIYDWSREVVTCLPDYYKWTEWFFLKLYEAGLAYRGKAPVNWCPRCQTVLANEQVLDGGFCERCGATVSQRDLEQWFFRITKYADELLEYKDTIWSKRVKTMQRNWIGKSQGAEISFALDHPSAAEKEIRVFTTRPDTTFGVTFMVLAPEHSLVAKLATPDKKTEVEDYIAQSRRLSEIERLSTEKEKDGVFIGTYCLNRLNGEKVPIWIADYVLLSYGTGAVMGVPAHDERDFTFARKYNLPIPVVIAPPDWSDEELAEAYTGPGTMVNSDQFNGLPYQQGMEAVCDWLEEKGWGKRAITYRLRDWLISRQRYWGAPIPIVYCDKCGIVPVPEKDLPVLLPEDAEFKPTGESPLKYHEQFVNTTCPRCSAPAKRETDTMDTFMCSNWYFLRYTSPGCDTAAFDANKVKYWMPIDIYTGGAEHAVMHLLYSRFFSKAIRDMGLVDFDEPFQHMFNQGIIIAEKQKMSKSRGNVITPDDYVSEVGADTIRTYLMFLAPWEQGGEWDDSGISGISRWLNRIWNLVLGNYHPQEKINLDTKQKATRELSRTTHQTIKKVTEDLGRLHFNTMVAALMEFTNYLGKVKEAQAVTTLDWEESIDTLLRLLSPTTPHLTEELWQKTGREYSIHNQSWPVWDEALAKDEEITLVVQVNGKVRDRITVPASITEDEARQLAPDRPKIKPYLTDKTVTKVIYVPGKLVNLVMR